VIGVSFLLAKSQQKKLLMH